MSVKWATSDAALAEFDAAQAGFSQVNFDDPERFLIEADLRFALQSARTDAAFEDRDLRAAEEALRSWEEKAPTSDIAAEEGATHRFNLGICVAALGIAKGRRDCFDRARSLLERTSRDAAAASLAALHGKTLHNLATLRLKLMSLERQLSADGFREASELCALAAQSFRQAGDAEALAAAKQSEGESRLFLAACTHDFHDSHRAGLVCAEAADCFASLAEGDWTKWAAKSRYSAAAAFLQFAVLTPAGGDKTPALRLSAQTYEEAAEGFDALGDSAEAWRMRANQGFALVRLFLETSDQSVLDRAADLFVAARDAFQKAGLKEDTANAQKSLVFVLRRKQHFGGELAVKAAAAHVKVADLAKQEGNAEEEKEALKKALDGYKTALRYFGESGALKEYGEVSASAGALLCRAGQLNKDVAQLKDAAQVSARGAMALLVGQDNEGAQRASNEASMALDALEKVLASKFDSGTQTVVTRSGGSEAWGSEEGEGEPIDHEVVAPVEGTLSSQFEEKAAALAAARTQALDALEATADLSLEDVERVLLPEVREATITRVQRLIEQAQQEAPEDKVTFVRVVRRLLCAADLELRAVGSSAKTTLTMKGSSLGLSVSGRGSVGFAGVPVEVVRATPPEFAPRPSRSKAAPSPKPS